MVAGAFDVEHDLLVKLAYYLQSAAETAGGANSYTMLLPSMAPNAGDSRQVLLVKAAYWAKQIADNIGGGSGSQEIYTGAAPPAAPADPTKPAMFYPSGGGAIQQWDVGGAAWV